MDSETERIQFWYTMETGKCVGSAVSVDNSDMNGSISSQWTMKSIQFSGNPDLKSKTEVRMLLNECSVSPGYALSVINSYCEI